MIETKRPMPKPASREAQLAAAYSLDDELAAGTAVADAVVARRRVFETHMDETITAEIKRRDLSVLELGERVTRGIVSEDLYRSKTIRERLIEANKK